MKYIVLDFEWNQPLSEKERMTEPFSFDSEIIQIGAIKVDENFQMEDEYNSLVLPSFYKHMHGDVVGLTKIRAQMLEKALPFPEVFASFQAWCGDDCGLCSWGPTDIPVLMDNMLIHNISLENFPPSYDLQRIFAREILREDRQCSLTDAVKLLQLPIDRAHDALNDARNTVRICDRMDLAGCIEEYETYYVNYEKDRRSGLVEGKQFPNTDALLKDEEMNTVHCPYCGKAIHLEYSAKKNGKMFGYGVCAEGDEVLARVFVSAKTKQGILAKRTVNEVSTDLWDLYQQALGKN